MNTEPMNAAPMNTPAPVSGPPRWSIETITLAGLIVTVGLALATIMFTTTNQIRDEAAADRAVAAADRTESAADRRAFQAEILRLTAEQARIAAIVDQQRSTP